MRLITSCGQTRGPSEYECMSLSHSWPLNKSHLLAPQQVPTPGPTTNPTSWPHNKSRLCTEWCYFSWSYLSNLPVTHHSCRKNDNKVLIFEAPILLTRARFRICISRQRFRFCRQLFQNVRKHVFWLARVLKFSQ